MANSKKTRFVVLPGTRVQTTTAFADMFPEKPVWRGVVVRPFVTIDGAWYVNVDGIPKTQIINKVYLEAEACNSISRP